MTVREAEEDARQLLDSSWNPEGGSKLPVDPMQLARSLGLTVQIVPLPADESGKIESPAGKAPVVSLNVFDSTNRQRFTCAHEIGHYVRRRKEGLAPVFVDYRGTLAGLGKDPEEIYANQFAAAILMPAGDVQRFVRQGLSAEEMARTFGTSVQAMELRLRNLHLA